MGASQLLATAFPFIAVDFEAGQRLLWTRNQFLATAFSFVAADFVPHLGGLSEGQAGQGLPSHWLRQYGREAAS